MSSPFMNSDTVPRSFFEASRHFFSELHILEYSVLYLYTLYFSAVLFINMRDVQKLAVY